MPLLEIKAPITMDSPTLVLAVSGWVDAGYAATKAGEYLTETGRVVVAFRPDEIYDYRSSRPTVDFAGGTASRVTWPDLSLTAVSVGNTDLLVLTGNEPNLRWQAVANELAGIASTVNVRRVITLGAVPAAVPHTRPTPIMVTSSDPTIEPAVIPAGRFTVPAALVNVLAYTVARDVGAVDTGYWAQIPHYVSGIYWPATASLVGRTARALGITLDIEELNSEAAEQQARLDEATRQNRAASQYVRRLEELGPGSITPMSGEQLSEEIEEFLRSVGDENPFE